MAGAQEVLEELRHSYTLALLTQGDPTVQEKRIDASGLSWYFERVDIVERKTASSFGTLLDWAGADPASAWSIGNSLASDINPSLSRGMNAIWIKSHVWEYERRDLRPIEGRLITVRRLIDVPAVLNAETLAAGGRAR
jgi:putative hydrolase of the HAD superfamily